MLQTWIEISRIIIPISTEEIPNFPHQTCEILVTQKKFFDLKCSTFSFSTHSAYKFSGVHRRFWIVGSNRSRRFLSKWRPRTARMRRHAQCSCGVPFWWVHPYLFSSFKNNKYLYFLEKTLSRDMACSHIRAWQLFLETIKAKESTEHKCEFIAFSCPGGLPSFEKGRCFPKDTISDEAKANDILSRRDLGRMGEEVSGKGRLYFITKGSSPFCGK